jgi:glutathionylspermidine synthase
MELVTMPVREKKNVDDIIDRSKKLNEVFVDCENMEKYINNMTEFRYLQVDKEKEQFIEKSMHELYKLFFCAMEYVLDKANEEEFRNFCINEAFWDDIRQSLVDTPPEYFLYSRFDCGFSDTEDKMGVFELNTGCNGLLYYTSDIQDIIYQKLMDKRQGISSGARVNELLTQKWKKIVNKYLVKTKCVYFVIDDDDDERILAYHFTEILNSLDIETKIGFKDECIYLGDDNKVYDKESNSPVELIHTTFQWNTIFTLKAKEEVCPKFVEILLNPNVQVLEPKWATVLGNKALMATVWKLHPNNSLLLPTTFDPNDKVFQAEDELFEKHVKGRGSFQVNLIKRDDSGVFKKNDECIYQKKFNDHHINGRFYIVAPWMIGNEYAGFLVKETQSLINDWDGEMVSTRIVDSI